MREVRKKWQQLSCRDRSWFCATDNLRFRRVCGELRDPWSPCGAFLPLRIKRSRAFTRDMTVLRHQLLTVPNAIVSLLKCCGAPWSGHRWTVDYFNAKENSFSMKMHAGENRLFLLFPKQWERDSAAVSIFSMLFSQATVSQSTCQSSSAEHARNDLSRLCLFRLSKRPPLALRLYWNTSACFIHTLPIPPEGQVSFRNEARHSFFPGVFPLLPARALQHADLCLQ